MAKNGCSEFFLTKKKKKEDWLKFGMAKIFSQKDWYQFFLEKIVRKNLEWPFLAISNLYQSFWEKSLEKIQNSYFGHSEFMPVFLGKTVRKN